MNNIIHTLIESRRLLSIFCLHMEIDNMSKIRNHSYNQLILMFVATIIGCFISNIWIHQSYDVSEFDLLAMKSFDTMSGSAICSVILKRIEQFAVVLLAFRVFQVEPILNILVAMFGCVLGFLLSVQSYYQGIKGIFVIIFMVMPQFIMYYISLIYIRKCIRLSDDKKHKLQFIMLSILLFVLGIIFECIFSEKIFKYFYQYMVTVY